jgi:hypothetical protein
MGNIVRSGVSEMMSKISSSADRLIMARNEQERKRREYEKFEASAEKLQRQLTICQQVLAGDDEDEADVRVPHMVNALSMFLSVVICE